MTDTTPEQEFAAALAAFQVAMPKVAKDNKATVKSDKGNYSYAYADLTDITEVAAPLLGAQGLSFTSSPTITDHGFVLRYCLLHTAGHREGGDFPLPDPSKFGAQQIGSWLTYARRYALCAVTGIAPGGDDDDAQKANDARSVDISAPKRAQRASRGEAAPSDPWQTDPAQEPERVTDVAWIEGFRQRVTAATNTRDLQALQGEANGKWGENKLSREDAQALRAEVSERTRELTAGVPA
jgi:hypothetical protein